MADFKFTKRHIEALPATGKQYFVKDPKTPGLVLLVSQSGAKTFFLRRKIDGKDERIRIGRFPAWTVEQAQQKATEINNTINQGNNPNEVKRALKAEPTFEEVFRDYLDKKRKRSGEPLSDRTKDEYQKAAQLHLGPIIGRKLSDLKQTTIRQLHAAIKSPAQSNKIKAIIGAVFRWAADEGITDLSPPVRGLKNQLIRSRERFLQPDEIRRFLEAVDASPQRDFFLLALLTGARRENILAMQWKELDLGQAVWRIPKTKNGESQTIPLTHEAVAILESRKQGKIVNALWVFPGSTRHVRKMDGEAKKPTGHMHMPRRAWSAVLAHAGLDNHLRFHDLRRTLGSWQARQGASLAVIGKSLGHKSHQATQIYSRLDLDPVRSSIESATTAMLDQAKKK